MDILQLLMVVVVFVLAGGVKGVTGMGLPTVAVSLLGLWMPPVQAAALLVIPSLATNIAQCRGPHLRSLVSRLWPGWLAIAIVTLSAPGLGDAVSVQTTKGWLGGILMAYGIWGLWRPPPPPPPSPPRKGAQPADRRGHWVRDGTHGRLRIALGSLLADAAAGQGRDGASAGPFIHRGHSVARHESADVRPFGVDLVVCCYCSRWSIDRRIERAQAW